MTLKGICLFPREYIQIKHFRQEYHRSDVSPPLLGTLSSIAWLRWGVPDFFIVKVP